MKSKFIEKQITFIHLFVFPAILFIFMFLLFSCNFLGMSPGPCAKWPPPDSIGAKLSKCTNDTTVLYRWSFQASGMAGMNEHGDMDNPMDENDVKKRFNNPTDEKEIQENTFRIKGVFFSKIGTITTQARISNWTKIYDSTGDSRGSYSGWGVILDSGTVIVSKKQMKSVDKKVIYSGNYTLGEINRACFIIAISEAKKEKVFLLYDSHVYGSRPVFRPIANAVGTVVHMNKCTYEVRKNGWYYNDTELVFDSSKMK